MPVPRTCFHCGKTLMTSTYGMIHHVSKCTSAPSETRRQLKTTPLNKPAPRSHDSHGKEYTVSIERESH